MDVRESLAEFLRTDLARKHPTSMIVLLLLGALAAVVASIAPVYVLPLVFLVIAGFLLSLLYTEYAFALMPLLLVVRDLSLVSIPALRAEADSVDIRLAELAVALFALLCFLRLTVSHGGFFLTKEAKQVLLFCFWVMVSWLWSPYPPKAILLGVRLLLSITSSLLCVNVFTKKEALSRIVLAWVATATTIAILTLIDFQVNRARVLEAASLGRIGAIGGRATLLFGHPNLLAPFLNYGFFLTLGVWRAVSRPKGVVRFLPLALALMFFALLATLSRGAWVAFAAGAAVFGLFSKGKWRNVVFISVLILLTLVLVVLIQPHYVQVLSRRLVSITDFEGDRAIRTRFVLWKAALQIARKQVLWGVGLGTFGEVGERYANESPGVGFPSFAHNNYIQVLVALGLVGVTLFLSVLGRVLMNLYRIYRKASDPFSRQISLGMLAGLVMLAANNMFTNDLFEVQTWLFLGLCMSMINITRNRLS